MIFLPRSLVPSSTTTLQVKKYFKSSAFAIQPEVPALQELVTPRPLCWVIAIYPYLTSPAAGGDVRKDSEYLALAGSLRLMVTAEGGVVSLAAAVESALDEHLKALVPKPAVTATTPPPPSFSFSAAKVQSPEVVRSCAVGVESESESVSDPVVAVRPSTSGEVAQAVEPPPPAVPVAAPTESARQKPLLTIQTDLEYTLPPTCTLVHTSLRPEWNQISHFYLDQPCPLACIASPWQWAPLSRPRLAR